MTQPTVQTADDFATAYFVNHPSCDTDLDRDWLSRSLAKAVETRDAAIRADELGKVVEWRPIESAPRDGTRIVVYRPLAHLTHDANVDIKRSTPTNHGCWQATIPKGMDDTNFTDGYCKPTHWMPIPEAPK